MTRQKLTVNIRLLLLTAMTFSGIQTAHAHHSFSAFDLESKTSKVGVLTHYRFAQPHITMELEVTTEGGSVETWEIESLVPRRWNSMNLDKDFVEVGDHIEIVGWAAKDGSTEMMLSAIISEKGELVARETINQRQE